MDIFYCQAGIIVYLFATTTILGRRKRKKIFNTTHSPKQRVKRKKTNPRQISVLYTIFYYVPL